MMRDDFAVFIITHKRPQSQMTVKTLCKGGYTGKIFFIVDDEDDTIDEYCKIYGKDIVKTFHKENNFDLADSLTDYKGVPVYARNVCFEIAKSEGLTHFVQLDDDYPKIDFRYEKDGNLRSTPVKNFDLLFTAMCNFLDILPIHCVAFAVTGDYTGGINGCFKEGLYRNARNSFFCRTDRPFKFLGRINEDVSTPAVNNCQGRLFFTFMGVQVTLFDHEKNKGGSTEQYCAVNTYWSYFYPVLFEPSAIRIVKDKKGFIKHVNWNALLPQIINERWRKTNA